MEKNEPDFIPNEGVDLDTEKDLNPKLEERHDTQEAQQALDKILSPSTNIPAESEANRQASIRHIREVIRTDRSHSNYEKVFGKEITKPMGMILDLGAGDSNFADFVNEEEGDLKVVRCDFGYSENPPKNKKGAVAGLAQELPFKDGSFEKVVSSCLMEHIREVDAPKVLAEMLRVTQNDGEILIFPSYQSLKGKYSFARREIVAKNLLDRIKLKLAHQPTLIITKDSSLSEEEWQKAVEDIVRSVRLPKIIENIERIYMKIRLQIKGDVKMHR